MADKGKIRVAEVFCLAEYLVEEMDAREWTTVDVAERMEIYNGFVCNKMFIDLMIAVTPTEDNFLIDDETFSGLARAFGTSRDFFKSLHLAWVENPEVRSSFKAPDYIYGPDWARVKFPQDFPSNGTHEDE